VPVAPRCLPPPRSMSGRTISAIMAEMKKKRFVADNALRKVRRQLP